MGNQEEINFRIEEQILKDHMANSKVVKILILGAAESGKSTVLKQMKIIHLNGYSELELKTRRPLIFMNVIHATTQLIEGCRILGIPTPMDLDDDIDIVLTAFSRYDFPEQFSRHLVKSVKNIWSQGCIQEAYGRANEFQLIDSAKYFIESIDRLANDDYIPTIQDVLYARHETIGVTELNFQDMEFRVFDVGGQKTQRRKWIHLFDNVHALLFLAAISEYDQTLSEDSNRVKDSLILFKSIVNHEAFVKVAVILFLNKVDIFQRKIEQIPLTICFARYRNRNNFEDCCQYIRRRFEKQVSDQKKTIYTHFTCATDTDGMEKVINSVINMVLENSLKETGYLT